MSTSISPSSANGIKSRPPSSGHSSQPQEPPRSKPEKINGSSITPNNNKQTSRTNYSFAKITTIVFLIAIADVLFIWHSINASIGGEGEEPHHLGAEAGLHHLHEKKRMKQLNDHVKNKHLKQNSVVDSDNGSQLQLQSNKVGASENQKRVITVNTNGDVIGKDFNKISGANKNSEKKSSHQMDERIAKILKSAHVEVDKETSSQLPTWENVISQYGEKPIIYGLETCEPYRNSVKPEDRMIGPAGIFNTGTNLLFQLMKENCDIKEAIHSQSHKEPKRNGVRWQAPWGKHNPPATHKLKNVAKMWGEGINQTAFFPVVMIKDPYHWMGSQCRHHYQTWWDHKDGNCPNLIAKNIVHRDVPVDVKVKYALGWIDYESLTDMWNKWYEGYEEQSFPMLRMRFEDLLFHGEEVTRIACDCVGGKFTNHFTYIEGSAKENGMPIHNGANGLLKAMIQYGDPNKRLNGLTDRDRLYASKSLSSNLMEKFGYTAPI
mmetsp:Transcript_18430/g.33836  ORF Transcript_18430/g.33836 Transcript_18430/m.33836 type:complete len:491 (-) Transcript_18430:98-1570(-)|eukprot:CAMPEP_0202015170 /NCGR_PEP_ID=MMETSP0905-20130828/31255_1 /ASSEMBLY_ACC=CAM_ASM_000554 /TAXON_ID=420261 /ORGANISM="Thalassiosira antarctica, Strain CCMP982" /LENGTH=490 /DNA_ID=CAMNT_0048575251 /DNA_START=106 /DNA_END=1578 /DNA_ORIENTATION=-